MKTFHPRFLTGRDLFGTVAAACLSMMSATAWGFGLSGDQVQGNLILPWAPQAGNWFSIGADGSPISGLPVSAIVGPGIEFGYYPSSPGDSFQWSVTADLGDNQIRINERYTDSNPGSVWLVELSGFTLTLSGLDWAGAPGISGATAVLQDPHISLSGFDAHCVQFNVDEVVLYPLGPYSYSRTTVVQLAAVPEPSAAALLLWAGAVALRRRAWLIGERGRL
jgi:hypothetical protein